MKEFRGGRLAFQSDEHEGGGNAASVRSRGSRRPGCSSRSSRSSWSTSSCSISDQRRLQKNGWRLCGARVTLQRDECPLRRFRCPGRRAGHLAGAPGILERRAPWGGPRCTRGSEVPRIRALVDDGRPDVVSRIGGSGRGGCAFVGSANLPRDSPQRTCVPTQLMCMGVCASHRGRRRSGLHGRLLSSARWK